MSELFTLAEAAARLIAMRREQTEADAAAFRDAYRLGFEEGWQVGRIHLDHELVEQDRRRADYIRGIANSPTYAALELRRWDGRRQDFAKPRPGDHPGGPVAWETNRSELQGAA